jgi:putative nucleotidyltransferase with HDIG domain
MNKSCKVLVEHLQVGNFVRLPVAWKDHPFLFSSFLLKQQAQIELIKTLGISHVFVDLDRSNTQPLQDDQPAKDTALENVFELKDEMDKVKQERIEMCKKMRRELQKTEKSFSRSLAMMRSVMSKLRSRPLVAVNDANDLVNAMVKELLDCDNLVLHLMGDAKKDDNLYHHTLNVAVLSMLIAKEMNWPREDIETLGMGALFHDVGKFKIPPQILNKRTELSTPEQNFIRQHPAMGLDLIRLAENFPEKAQSIISQHHEFLDGSGFPKGLKAKELDLPSQLVAVVNEYDTLCHGSNQAKARTPYAALGFMYKNYQGKLNKEVMGLMIKMLGIYPPGSVVELSSGQYGMVMSVNLSKLLLPRILVYDALVPKDQAPLVDLEQEGLTIVRCLPPAALPEKVFNYLNPRDKVSYYFGGEGTS